MKIIWSMFSNGEKSNTYLWMFDKADFFCHYCNWFAQSTGQGETAFPLRKIQILGEDYARLFSRRRRGSAILWESGDVQNEYAAWWMYGECVVNV